MPSSMRVPRFMGAGKIDFHDKPVPSPGPGQLLVAVKANALCGSERGQFQHGSNVTPGHEAAGVIAAAGLGTRTAPGTPGVIFLMDFCGQCRSCRRGFTNQCLAKRADMGFNRDGGYGSFELVDENIFFPVDRDIPLDEATLLLDIMGTGGHALKRAALVHDDIQSVIVTGAGPIGLGLLAMVKIVLGQNVPVVITDVVPYRLDLAEKMGGIPINVGSQTLAEVLKKAGLTSADLAIDSTGRAAARQSALDALGQRGVLICVGHGEKVTIEVSPQLIAPERSVLGSEYFCFNELPENLARLRQHRAYLSQIITHRFPVADIQKAFEIFFEGRTGKVIVEQ